MIAIIDNETKDNNYKEPAIICDLDGTLALKHSGRTWYDASTCDADIPNEPVRFLVDMMFSSHHIIFCSGREDKYREPTMAFINKCFDGKLEDHDYTLLMRETNDNRKDSIVKHELYLNHIEHRWDILYVLDDRQQVVDMWRNALGLLTLQVAEGNF